VVLRRHDPTHRFAHCGVVDRVLELVAFAGGRDIDDQFHVDLERLRAHLFFGKNAVHAHLTYPGDEDAVHGSTLVA
jgi:hypothetical protein